jgi:DnaJ-class molecular chaperone
MATRTDKAIVWETVSCAYCQGTGHDRWDLLSALSSCSACSGRGTQLVEAPVKPCPHCGGTGNHPHLRVTCTTCHGAGMVHVAPDAIVCPVCKGRGIAPGSELYLACVRCGGGGWTGAEEGA